MITDYQDPKFQPMVAYQSFYTMVCRVSPVWYDKPEHIQKLPYKLSADEKRNQCVLPIYRIDSTIGRWLKSLNLGKMTYPRENLLIKQYFALFEECGLVERMPPPNAGHFMFTCDKDIILVPCESGVYKNKYKRMKRQI